MKFGVDVKGLDEMKRKIERLSENAKALDGTHSVPLKELLTDEFLRTHTAGRFGSVEAWLEKSPFRVDSQADFDAIPEATLDDYVRASTDFTTMHDMAQAAGAAYIKRRLFEE
ncbi:MAG TPA: hypothetical protein VMX54_18960 [Vicinamibacteria bacterium]|nr:hypothetical protein [Vicinamibacteria bacterium]